MGKERKEHRVDHPFANLKEQLEAAGFKPKIVEIKLLHTRVVNNFVMKIEEAHKKAGKSKLIFKSSLVSNLQPANS